MVLESLVAALETDGVALALEFAAGSSMVV
jgi:hypothetical protein